VDSDLWGINHDWGRWGRKSYGKKQLKQLSPKKEEGGQTEKQGRVYASYARHGKKATDGQRTDGKPG